MRHGWPMTHGCRLKTIMRPHDCLPLTAFPAALVIDQEAAGGVSRGESASVPIQAPSSV